MHSVVNVVIQWGGPMVADIGAEQKSISVYLFASNLPSTVY